MTLSTQFVTMISMVLMGSYFGAAFDTYHRLFNRSNRQAVIVFINDLIFWLLQGLIAFYLLYQINFGEIRFYIFLALLCGFAAYQSLLKGGYLRLLETVISVIVSIYRLFVKIIYLFIYKPVRSLVLFVFSLLIFIAQGLWTLVKFIYSTLRLMIRIIFSPIKWIGTLFLKLLPENILKSIKKLYNRCNSLINHIRKLVRKWLNINTRKK